MTLDDIRSTLRIEEVEEALGLSVASIAGPEHICHCPLPSHPGNDAHPSFSLNVDKLVYNCFSCGGGGSLTNLVSEITGLNYEESLNWLATFSDFAVFADEDLFAIQIQRILEKEEVGRIRRETQLPWFPKEILNEYTQQIELCYDWLRNRNISDSVIKDFSLGYSANYFDGTNPYPALVIPHIFLGEVRGWQARYMGEEPRPKSIQKYKSTNDFPKEFTLYNYDRVAGTGETVIVVESPLTVCTLASYGYNAVATFGASFPDPRKKVSDQIRLLQNMQCPLLLAFDNDPAGHLAITRLVEHLEQHTPIDIVPPPSGEKADLGDLPHEEVAILLEQAVPGFLWEPNT